MLAHTVFFSLNDRTDAARRALVEACQAHLTGHPGTVFFACGTLAEGYDRPVNDQEFDVALHLVFESRAAHDAYQVAPRHQTFIEQNKPTWARVRVFDAEVEGAPAS